MQFVVCLTEVSCVTAGDCGGDTGRVLESGEGDRAAPQGAAVSGHQSAGGDLTAGGRESQVGGSHV